MSNLNERQRPDREAASPQWPSPLAPEAFYGLAGDVVMAITLHTEADPASLLLNFLTFFGNAAGREPHAIAEAARHGCNLNVAIVGDTAKSRKGSSTGRIEDLFKRVDPNWAARIQHGGLSSGEGLIWAVRDPITKREPAKQKGKPTGDYEEVIVDPGVDDKCLLVVESELVNTLQVMARQGSTLSPLIRQAWDRGDLSSLTKNSPARATGAHISILGHITRDELTRCLTQTEAANGFANRFLWTCSRRAQVLPEGGGTSEHGQLISWLHNALEGAGRLGLIQRDDEARRAWEEIYPGLSEGQPGLFGAVSARAEAQVLRLSVIYATLALSPVIKLPHLEAALAVWDYCEASARYIFGDATGDPVADRIMEALRNAPEGLTRTQINDLLGRNIPMPRISEALGLLLRLGRVWLETVATEGRPREFWYATR